MNSELMPTVKIELEGMRQSIVKAFSIHQTELTQAVDQEIVRQIQTLDMESIVRSAVAETMRREIEMQTRSAISMALYENREVKNAIRKAVEAAMTKVSE